MLAPWASEEMKTADLPDKRLNERLAIVLSQLAGQPTASIPAACGGYAEMAAAYRLFENERLCFDDVLQPHIDATRRRVAEQPVVILAQDTTELDFTRPQQQVVGAGPVDGSKRRGAFLHPLHAFTPDGVPLGTVAARSLGPIGRAALAGGGTPGATQKASHRTEGKPALDRHAAARPRARLRSAGHAVHLRGRQRGRYL